MNNMETPGKGSSANTNKTIIKLPSTIDQGREIKEGNGSMLQLRGI